MSVTDASQRRRMVIQPETTGAVVEATMDNTTPAQLQTMASPVDKILVKSEKEKQKGKTEYAAKRQTEGKPTIREKTVRKVLLTEVEEDSDEYFEEEAEIEEDNTASSSFKHMYFANPQPTTTSQNPHLLLVDGVINNTPISLCLATGALVSIMSNKTAQLLNLKPTEEEETVRVKGIHQNKETLSLSQPVTTQLTTKCKLLMRFALAPTDIITILALPELKLLKVTINLANMTVEADGEPLPCNTALTTKEKGILNVPDILQQVSTEELRK